jgi:hypothetical protein
MGALAPPPEENNLKPWADDERLNDPLILGTFYTTTNLIQRYATLAEKLPDGGMPKTTSIPAMWKTVKDLKPESVKKLQHAIQNLEQALKLAEVDSKSNKEEDAMEEISTKKDDERLARESGKNIESLLIREAAVFHARGKKRAEHDDEIEGVGPSKDRKFKEGFMRHPSVNAEGTYIKPIPTTGHRSSAALQSVRSCMNKRIIHIVLVPCAFQ